MPWTKPPLLVGRRFVGAFFFLHIERMKTSCYVNYHSPSFTIHLVATGVNQNGAGDRWQMVLPTGHSMGEKKLQASQTILVSQHHCC